MDGSVGSRDRSSRQLLFGLILASLIFPSAPVADELLDSDEESQLRQAGIVGNEATFLAQLAERDFQPGLHYRFENLLEPLHGRLLSIEEFKETGNNFEYCDEDRGQVTLDLLTVAMQEVPETCDDTDPSTFILFADVANWQGAAVYDAELNFLGSLLTPTNAVLVRSGSENLPELSADFYASSFSLSLNPATMTGAGWTAETQSLMERFLLSIDLTRPTVVTGLNASGEIEIYLPNTLSSDVISAFAAARPEVRLDELGLSARPNTLFRDPSGFFAMQP